MYVSKRVTRHQQNTTLNHHRIAALRAVEDTKNNKAVQLQESRSLRGILKIILKGTVSDNKNIQKKYKEKYLSITACIIFLKKSHNFDSKTTF